MHMKLGDINVSYVLRSDNERTPKRAVVRIMEGKRSKDRLRKRREDVATADAIDAGRCYR